MRHGISPLLRRRLLALVGVVLLAAAAWQSRVVFEAGSAWTAAAAADALPLYLTTRVVAQGGDPTDMAALQQAYQELGLQTRVLMFSTLYPASLAALLQPLAELSWPDFLHRLRQLVLAAWVLGLALAGAGTAGPGRRLLGAGVGAAFAVWGQPLLVPALGLGQANLLITGLFGGVLGALAWGRNGLAAGFAVLGAAVKLVPGLAVWPLLAGRRWRGLAVGVVVGLGVVAWTFAFVDPRVAVEGVWRTIRFQGNVAPAWAAVEIYPRILHMLAASLRHGPLGWLTLVLVGVAAFRAPRPAVLAGGSALGMAWLGGDAAGVGVFYATFATPAAVWLLVRPLRSQGSRLAWLLAPLSGGFLLLLPDEVGSLVAELHMLAACFLVWAGCAVLLLWDSQARLDRPARLLVVVAALVTLGLGGWRAVQLAWIHPLPPPPGPGQVEQHQGPDLGDMDPARHQGPGQGGRAPPPAGRQGPPGPPPP